MTSIRWSIQALMKCLMFIVRGRHGLGEHIAAKRHLQIAIL